MRTNAEINLKVNARALGDLDRAMEDAFDPSRVKDTEGAVEDLAEGLADAGGSARVMAEGLGDAADTRTDFKRLREELRGVRQEAQRVNRELRKTAKLMQQATGRGAGAGGGVPGGGLGMGGGTFRPRPQHAATPGAAAASTTPGAGGGGGDKTSAGYGALAAGLSAIPYAGMAMGAFLALGGQAYGSHIGRETARRGTYAARTRGDTTLSARAFEDVGAEFGYKPGEAQGMYGQLMSQAGSPLGRQSFQTAMGLQQTYGIGLAQSGALIQAARRAGGHGSVYGRESVGRDILTESLKRAVQMGLDGSELSTYMQQQTQMIAKEAELGARELHMDRYQAVEAQMTGRVGGYQAQRMTRQFAEGVSEIGYSGAGGATEFLLAQQAGYRPGMGTEAYFSALQQMQDIAKNPEMMSGYLQQFISEDAGEATNIAMVQRAYSAATGGQKLHAETAKAYIRGDGQALLDEPGDLGTARGVHADLVTEAGFEARRADVGRTVAPAMQQVTRSTIAMAEAMDGLSPVIELAATGLEGVAKMGGAAVDVLEPFMEAIQKLTDWIQANM